MSSSPDRLTGSPSTTRLIERCRHRCAGRRTCSHRPYGSTRAITLYSWTSRRPDVPTSRLVIPVRHGVHHGVLAHLGVVEFGYRPPFAQDDDPVRTLGNLLQLRGDHQHTESVIGELVDQTLDLGFGADVDTTRRFVEQQ